MAKWRRNEMASMAWRRRKYRLRHQRKQIKPAGERHLSGVEKHHEE
jgi:hypothetical protein